MSRDDPARPLLGSMGIYMFKTKVLNDLLTYHLRQDDFGGDIIPAAIDSQTSSMWAPRIWLPDSLRW